MRLVAIALPCAATRWALRPSLPPEASELEASGSPYRDGRTPLFGPWFPVPAGTIAVFTIAATRVATSCGART